LVTLAESRKRPIRKKEGVFVFVDLDRMTYTLIVESDIYFTQTIKVDPDRLDRLNPVIYVRMKPLPSYPFNKAATLLRGRLVDKSGSALADAAVRAVVKTRECAKGRILQENVLPGSSVLSLARLNGKISEGETLIIEGKDEEQAEICRISCLYEDNSYGLCEPLKFDHGRGSFLFPVTETMPDERGETVVYFFNLRVPGVEVELQISHDGMANTGKYEIEAGGTYNFGTLKIT
ncbi:MAG: hypothetical protein ABFD08_08635, partial [Syntrophomonas sp.]